MTYHAGGGGDTLGNRNAKEVEKGDRAHVQRQAESNHPVAAQLREGVQSVLHRIEQRDLSLYAQ